MALAKTVDIRESRQSGSRSYYSLKGFHRKIPFTAMLCCSYLSKTPHPVEMSEEAKPCVKKTLSLEKQRSVRPENR